MHRTFERVEDKVVEVPSQILNSRRTLNLLEQVHSYLTKNRLEADKAGIIMATVLHVNDSDGEICYSDIACAYEQRYGLSNVMRD